ncbi:uncharacterized protein TNCV_209231 [Trichonephila clavipes]|uniref:Mutator-like transposase domain-containing protein n=1 Tax=Trichonephila clavipes TaxID=2585209 RepID=A0A8X6SVQ8_TRICX|nr:uncharacterized protein TNCV_209231 [Trichonephila clavipes]
MRIIGKGFSAGKKLFSMLNIPYPSKCTYRQHEIKLLHAASQAANNSMLESAKSIAECSNECGVSVDGTWQKRGYSSLNECVSTISVDSGKILDIEVLSQYCRVCTKTEKTSGFSKKCVVSHFCKNHKGSASNMETVGAYRIFERSEANRSLRYTSYYGDGDSKAFNNVKDIYRYDSVVKYECIKHVQKRVGSRLPKLKKSTKGLGGKGKLTDKFIDTLQNYFGIAIRSNVGNLSNMQTAVIAAFFYCCSTDKKPMHGQCPSGSDTWCKYQKAKQEGKLYKHRTAGLPNAVLNTVKTTYMDLCDQSLLEKCLHGKTQNANESFNGVLWSIIPKETFVELLTLQFGAFLAVLQFNDGSKGILSVLEYYIYTSQWVISF